MSPDPSKWNKGEALSVRIDPALYARLIAIGERMIEAGWEDPNRSTRGGRSSAKAIAARHALPLGLNAIEAKLDAGVAEADEAPAVEPAAASTKVRRVRRLPVVKRGPDRRSTDGDAPAEERRQRKRRRDS